jgi:two-component system sensor histidine kinase DesK
VTDVAFRDDCWTSRDADKASRDADKALRDDRPGRMRGSLVGLIWIGLWMWPILGPAGAAAHGRVPHAPLATAGIALFMLLYLVITWWGFGHFGLYGLRLGGLIALTAVGVALAVAYADRPEGWLSLLLYVGVCATVTLRPRLDAAAPVAAALLVLAIGVPLGVSAGELGGIVFSTVMTGALVWAIKRMQYLIHELRETRQALAGSAVAQERLRFSRDLHDLLGHTLSVIVVKAEVIRRVGSAEARVLEQAADIERIGRQALVEVREAVTGYREGGLATELDRARGALADAGIETTVRADAQPLPAPVDSLLAWAVREGVTNVIRHSGARHCRIEVRRVDGRATAEVADDGVGGTAAAPGHGGAGGGRGNGLRGLAERMAQAGGEIDAGSGPGGGYRLRVRLPLDPQPLDPEPFKPVPA